MPKIWIQINDCTNFQYSTPFKGKMKYYDKAFCRIFNFNLSKKLESLKETIRSWKGGWGRVILYIKVKEKLKGRCPDIFAHAFYWSKTLPGPIINWQRNYIAIIRFHEDICKILVSQTRCQPSCDYTDTTNMHIVDDYHETMSA